MPIAMKEETRTMYFVMDTDSNGTESCFFSDEEQADKAVAKARDNIRDCHGVAFVYHAVVEMSGKPADFDLVEENDLCSDVLELKRVKHAHCTAIDAAHGQRFDISLKERLEEVATMIKGVMRDDMEDVEEYYDLEPGELRRMAKSDDYEEY